MGRTSLRDEATRRVLMPARPSSTILLCVGRISVEKRLEDVAAVLRARPETCFSIVGGGPHEAALAEALGEFGDRVHFTGVLTGDALSRAYASADVFVMPSDSETLGFVVLEAMASGLPVVAARAGGIPSIVDDDRNGVLVEPRDAERTKDKLGFVNVTANPGDVIIMGTPPGVGAARTPQVWMKDGDVCEIEIEGIGVLSNPIVAE